MRCQKLKSRARLFEAKMLRGCCAGAAALATVFAMSISPAIAGAWIPAAGRGEVEPMLRYSFADRSFDATSFSSKTHRSTKEQAAQIRLTGDHGLGHRFSLVYDFRYAYLHQSKTKKGTTIVDTNKGLQDQLIGLNYGLMQRKDFADAVGLSIIYPGSPAGAHPALDCGQWALEPDYFIGFKPGFADLTADLAFGARVFLDGGVIQFRTHFKVSAPITLRTQLFGKLLFIRSVRMSGYNELRDRAERYDILRLGIGMQFRVTKNIDSILAYDEDVAGIAFHANHRFTIGVKVKY